LTGWGIFLLAQRARFSLETGVTTLLFALLLLFGLKAHPANRLAAHLLPDAPARLSDRRLIDQWLAGLFILVLLASSAALVLTNNGLEAPGLALSVEPW